MYADLASVTEAIREPFGACGLAYTQTFMVNEKGPVIVTTLMHESGEWQRGELFIPATKLDPQQFGSAITYGRRYSLAAIGGVIQEDDDGNEASKPQPQQTQDDEKPWYNDFNDHSATMLAKLDSGEYASTDDIIAKLSEKFKINKKVRDQIKSLTK